MNKQINKSAAVKLPLSLQLSPCNCSPRIAKISSAISICSQISSKDRIKTYIFLSYCNKKAMQTNTIDFQNAKNRRRLIQQNNKLRQQVTQIEAQVDSLGESLVIEADIPDNSHQPLLQEIAMQERLIKQLRTRIQAFRLERAKDNVEYIIHEEDDLKIAKKLWSQLVDEKEVLTRRKEDKNSKLQNNLPYQHYEENFLSGLMEIVHHNREQGAKITEIQREIRKYHLMVKNGKVNPSKRIYTPENLLSLEKQVNEKLEQRKELEKQWKPHFQQLDEEYAKLLRELANKKETAAQLEREERSWDTRMLTIRDPEEVMNNKKRVSQVAINPKLKQQLEDYLVYEQQRKKKKVNNEELKYQFKSKEKQEEEEKAKAKKVEIPPPPSISKKREDKIIETMHDDKNISKKVQKGTAPVKKTSKVDQMHNTDISVPHKTEKVTSKDGESSAMASSKQKTANEQRIARHWEHNPESNKKQGKSSTKGDAKDAKNSILRLKEVSIATDARLWKNQEQF